MAPEKTVCSDVGDYENIISQIKEVISTRIVVDETGQIAEIHVLASEGRNPKQVVRDIESALMVKFGINIDHKKISVAQMQDENNFNPGLEVRSKVVGITTLLSGKIIEARVQLKIGDDIYEGCISGPGTSGNRLRLVSQATVSALEGYLKGTCSILTEEIASLTLSGRQVMVATISLVTNIGEEQLVGAVFVNHDEGQAVVKATLAAVNRRMSLLLE